MARLGDLERSVMDVLWDTEGWLTARDVASRLHHERDLAYTTVLTVLERLERKGFVRRQRAARAHRYTCANSREEVVAEAMIEALGAAGDRGSALVRFVGAVTAEEAEILRRALAAPVGGLDDVGDAGGSRGTGDSEHADDVEGTEGFEHTGGSGSSRGPDGEPPGGEDGHTATG